MYIYVCVCVYVLQTGYLDAFLNVSDQIPHKYLELQINVLFKIEYSNSILFCY